MYYIPTFEGYNFLSSPPRKKRNPHKKRPLILYYIPTFRVHNFLSPLPEKRGEKMYYIPTFQGYNKKLYPCFL